MGLSLLCFYSLGVKTCLYFWHLKTLFQWSQVAKVDYFYKVESNPTLS